MNNLVYLKMPTLAGCYECNSFVSRSAFDRHSLHSEWGALSNNTEDQGAACVLLHLVLRLCVAWQPFSQMILQNYIVQQKNDYLLQ